MGRKSVVKSFKMFQDQDISTNVSSEETSIINLDKASIRISWTGTPVGEVQVMVRNGEKEPWYELSMGAVVPIDGSESDHVLVFNELPFTDIRLDYVSTSGSGTMDATISAKVVGA